MPRKLIALAVGSAVLLGFVFVSACEASADGQATEAEEAVVEEAAITSSTKGDIVVTE